jgi:hypothetical protein
MSIEATVSHEVTKDNPPIAVAKVTLLPLSPGGAE